MKMTSVASAVPMKAGTYDDVDPHFLVRGPDVSTSFSWNQSCFLSLYSRVLNCMLPLRSAACKSLRADSSHFRFGWIVQLREVNVGCGQFSSYTLRVGLNRMMQA